MWNLQLLVMHAESLLRQGWTMVVGGCLLMVWHLISGSVVLQLLQQISFWLPDSACCLSLDLKRPLLWLHFVAADWAQGLLLSFCPLEHRNKQHADDFAEPHGASAG